MKTFLEWATEPEKDWDDGKPERPPTILRHIHSGKELKVGDIVKHGIENAIIAKIEPPTHLQSYGRVRLAYRQGDMNKSHKQTTRLPVAINAKFYHK